MICLFLFILQLGAIGAITLGWIKLPGAVNESGQNEKVSFSKKNIKKKSKKYSKKKCLPLFIFVLSPTLRRFKLHCCLIHVFVNSNETSSKRKKKCNVFILFYFSPLPPSLFFLTRLHDIYIIFKIFSGFKEQLSRTGQWKLKNKHIF